MMLLLKEQCHAKLMARLEKAEVVAVSIDESQDVAMKGQMVVYLTFWDEDANSAVVEFLTIKTLKGAKAEDIVAAMKEVLKEGGLFIKVVHLGSDGCSVMTGKKKIVGHNLRQEIEDLIQCHCANHRAALGANDAANLVDFPMTSTNFCAQSAAFFVGAEPTASASKISVKRTKRR